MNGRVRRRAIGHRWLGGMGSGRGLLAWRVGLAICLGWAVPAAASGDYEYTIADGSVTINRYLGSEENVTIPSTIEGLLVTRIGMNAFAELGIESVVIADSVTAIGEYSFHSCVNLSSVTIPESVSVIGSHAFSKCTSLPTIRIPRSVREINSSAFRDCPNLASIEVDPTNPQCTSVDGVLFDKEMKILRRYPQGKPGATFSIPNTVQQIGGWAFHGCSKLTEIQMPSGITSIESGAFFGCDRLPSLRLPSSVNFIGHSAFEGCARLGEMIIPEGVDRLGTSVFAGCISLTKVEIPESVQLIERGAFEGCSSLASVRLPSRLTSIGDRAFQGCSSLTEVRIPEGVVNLGSWAFDSCTNLKSATIPASVGRIDFYAFQNCTELRSVYFQGNAPVISYNLFFGADQSTLYYLPGTTGWTSPFADRPARLWNPHIEAGAENFGPRAGGFDFTVTGASGLTVVVEANETLGPTGWTALATNLLSGGLAEFRDGQGMDRPARFYRMRAW